jgi:hypothetical protein
MSIEGNEYKNNHLQVLSDSDYEIVDGEPDITGWNVRDRHGRKIGEVDDMLFDPQSRKVRYIIVELQDVELDLVDGDKVLIPIGVADLHRSGDAYPYLERNTPETDPRIDEKVIAANPNTLYEDDEPALTDNNEDTVIVPATIAQLRSLPLYEVDNLTPEAELTIRQVFENNGTIATEVYDRNGFYEHDYFDVDRFYDRGATTRSIVPVSEGSLDEPLPDNNTIIEPEAENPFDKDIEREEPGLGKIGF